MKKPITAILGGEWIGEIFMSLNFTFIYIFVKNPIHFFVYLIYLLCFGLILRNPRRDKVFHIKICFIFKICGKKSTSILKELFN